MLKIMHFKSHKVQLSILSCLYTSDLFHFVRARPSQNNAFMIYIQAIIKKKNNELGNTDDASRRIYLSR